MIYVEEVIECPTSILKAQAVVGRGRGEEEINAEKLAVQSNASFAGKWKQTISQLQGKRSVRWLYQVFWPLGRSDELKWK